MLRPRKFFRAIGWTAPLWIGLIGLIAFLLWVSGVQPWAAFRHLFLGSLGSWTKFAQVLRTWIPLTLSGCGLVFTFRIGLWNIGIEGQVMAGAVAATAVLRMGVGTAGPGVVLLLAFSAAVLGGGLWAGMAGLLKTKGGVNEIFGGLGLNFVAQGMILWLIFGPWKRPGVASMSGTELFPSSLWLPSVSFLRISLPGLALALLVIVATGWTLWQTRLGLALKGIGRNPRSSSLLGLRTTRYMLYAMGLAGGCAGLAGAFQVTGVYHRLIPAISSNYGYLALLVVMLGNYRVWMIPGIAFFFACLNVGSIQLPMVLQVDSSLSGVIQGGMVLGVLFATAWRKGRPVGDRET